MKFIHIEIFILIEIVRMIMIIWYHLFTNTQVKTILIIPLREELTSWIIREKPIK